MQEFEKARHHSQQALDLVEKLGSTYYASYAWTNLGLALLGLGRWEQAKEAFQQAVENRKLQGETALLQESRGGLARVALARENMNEALEQVEAILAFLNTTNGLLGQEITDWAALYITCYEVLKQTSDRRADELL